MPPHHCLLPLWVQYGFDTGVNADLEACRSSCEQADTCSDASPGGDDFNVAGRREDWEAIRRLQLGHDEAHAVQVLQAQALHLPQPKEDPLRSHSCLALHPGRKGPAQGA